MFSYSGNQTAAPYITQNNTFELVFASDSSVSGAGFEFTATGNCLIFDGDIIIALLLCIFA